MIDLLEKAQILCDGDYIEAKTKKLLIDLDGVICEYDFPKIVKDFFGVDLSSKEIFAYDLADVLGVAPDLINSMFEGQVYGKARFNDGALETLQQWKSKGYELLIFSNRIKYMGIANLALWLVNNKIPFSAIDSKGTGEYFAHIDDSPAKLAASDSKLKLLFNQPWNARCLDVYKQFIRVENWQKVREIIG